MSGLVVAVDGGGSKTDAVALTVDGRLVAHRRGPGSSPHFEGLAESVSVVDRLVRAVVGDAPVIQADLYLAGLDLPIEVERYLAAIAGLGWTRASTYAGNDLLALLRAGTDEPDAVAVVCGTGVNAIGVRADGVQARFPALGPISGDWGGGGGLGEEALWHAARDVDGRGPRTTLTAAIAERLGAPTVTALIEDLHFGRREAAELAELAPVVFEVARAGDAVAGRLVDRQADEIVAFARACITRLGLEGHPVPVVLGGGIIRSGDARLFGGIAAGLAADVPLARIEVFDSAPIVGAALLALGRADAGDEALRRARDAVSAVTRGDGPAAAVEVA